MLITLLPLVLACITSLIAVPAIIKVAYSKRLVDDPSIESRKIHKNSVPNLGGVAVFSTFALVSCLLINSQMLPNANFIFASGIIIFTIGLKDDLIALDPYKKFAAQFITAFIVVYFADVRLTNFYGVMGIHEIGPLLSYIFSSLVVVFIINAFNLIDGINGLLGSISMFVCLIYGTLFCLMDAKGLSVLSFSMAGAIVGFLKYNAKKRARIFMGDAGAYSIGFIISILTIQFIELNKYDPIGNPSPLINAAPGVAIALLIMPTFDTFRVFILRILRGKSPFMADRNHLHHRLLDLGLSHLQASSIIVATNLSMVALALAVHKQVMAAELIAIITLSVLFCNMMLWLYEMRNAHKILAVRERRKTILTASNKLTSDLEKVNNTAIDSSLAEIKVLASKEFPNNPKDIEAAKRFTQEVLDNLEKSKN
ncbi:undecaprenyl/decaprenyl-phosphate alpha-N-acetylglucosaminyl 1-phosphate transferase [Olivibacter sp. SDN3]|uniref:glycosyltransferase family 4 protein n=1 Tax=Olivibacter sp. SDN3 TaxID=2764720 RepID=UPI001651AFB5|nr:MraY family glycosyltransferase [Olivibacter sp. SDN3]QNL51580.1 undecaprenyl/decaprenyl-phosphate alpha-N-acetylglucosaminyl 1-phosphate transferase [Olivibacter sp. SDN3]